MQKQRSRAAAGTADTGQETHRESNGSATANPTQAPRKWARILGAFASGRSLNRFEAAREFRDWCLNTTISQLERRGVTINRKDETVPGAFGPVRCCRYTLAPQSHEFATQLLQEARAGAT